MKTVTGREEFMCMSQIPRYFEGGEAEDCKKQNHTGVKSTQHGELLRPEICWTSVFHNDF